MNTLLPNLRYALRQLRKSPGFTLTAMLTLALGIGATTAIYTVVYATLIADLPYPKPQELVMVWSTIHGNRNVVSAADYLDWKQQSTVFSGLYAFYMDTMNLGGIEDPEILHVDFGAPGWYTALGTPFSFGRDFLPEEANDGKNHVVILTNRLWRRLAPTRRSLARPCSLTKSLTQSSVYWLRVSPTTIPGI